MSAHEPGTQAWLDENLAAAKHLEFVVRNKAPEFLAALAAEMRKMPPVPPVKVNRPEESYDDLVARIRRETADECADAIMAERTQYMDELNAGDRHPVPMWLDLAASIAREVGQS